MQLLVQRVDEVDALQDINGLGATIILVQPAAESLERYWIITAVLPKFFECLDCLLPLTEFLLRSRQRQVRAIRLDVSRQDIEQLFCQLDGV